MSKCEAVTTSATAATDELNMTLIVGTTVGVGAFVVLLVVFITAVLACVFCRKRRR